VGEGQKASKTPTISTIALSDNEPRMTAATRSKPPWVRMRKSSGRSEPSRSSALNITLAASIATPMCFLIAAIGRTGDRVMRAPEPEESSLRLR
jgi:hypothetical protein